MDHRLRIGERCYEVTTADLGESGRGEIVIDGRSYGVELCGSHPDGYHVRVDGKPVKLFIRGSAGGTWVFSEGSARLVSDAGRVARRGSRSARGEGAALVTPLTPGVVVRVLVKVGERVRKGQGLVVVSAMKMESTIVSGHGGLVRVINTEVGATVQPGEVLVEVGRDDTEQEEDE